MTAPAIAPGQIVIPSRGLPLVPGGVAIAPPSPPQGQADKTVFFDPSLFPPPFATPINLAANQAIAGLNTFYTPAGLALNIPDNCYGIISTIDLLLDGITITSNVLWTIRINGVPVPGFNPLTILARSGAASVSKSWPGPLRLLIPVGGVIDVLIQNVDGGSYTAGTSLYGWFWPQERG